MKINKLRLKDRNIYLIIQYELFSTEDDFLDSVACELENGSSVLNINFGHASTSEIIKIAQKVRELCSIYNALLIVSDRLDIAQIIESDGVYLDENSFSVNIAREFLGNNYIIGTNYFEKDIDFMISDEIFDTVEIPCYKRVLPNNKDIKKIFYKKF